MDLFNSPMIINAKKNMTPEQLKDYERVGELVYNTIDYETGKIIDNSALELQELLMAINFGLKKEDLDSDDKKLLENYYTKDDIEALFKR